MGTPEPALPMSKSLASLLLSPLLAIAAQPVQAQEPTPPRWTLGLLAIDRDAPYRGYDEGIFVVPLVRFEGERFYVRGLRGAMRLRDTGTHEVALFAQARLDGYDADDSDFLTGMADRRPSLDLGISSSWRTKAGAFGIDLAADVLDRSGGVESTASWNGLFRAGGWTFIPGASVRWQSSDVVDYYYGVRPGEALPGRPAYAADAAVTPDVSLLATRPITQRWTFFARTSYAWLPSEIRNSPIVGQDGSVGLFIGVGYSPE